MDSSDPTTSLEKNSRDIPKILVCRVTLWAFQNSSCSFNVFIVTRTCSALLSLRSGGCLGTGHWPDVHRHLRTVQLIELRSSSWGQPLAVKQQKQFTVSHTIAKILTITPLRPSIKTLYILNSH